MIRSNPKTPKKITLRIIKFEDDLGSEGRIKSENNFANSNSEIETIVASVTRPITIRRCLFEGNRSLVADHNSIATLNISNP